MVNDNKDISGNVYVMLYKYYIKIFDLKNNLQGQTAHEVSETYTFVGIGSADCSKMNILSCIDHFTVLHVY